MRSFRYSMLFCGVCISISVSSAQNKDAEGCKDSPIVSRFPGSVITDCKDKADDVFEFEIASPAKLSQITGKKKIEGEFHQVSFNYPKTASKPQVVRNLNTAIKMAGYTFDYDSGDYGDFTFHKGKTWVEIEISGGGGYRISTVTETQLTQDVVANAADLSSGLTSNGHVVVNGILFDTGKDVVKPESSAALDEVVKMLKADAKMKVYVVGHTDNVGGLAANMGLSKRRAAAVVQLLTTKYAIPADRLQFFGAGPYAPIASNDSEDGRTLNRRVELVKQ
jgi:OOP family OmpA-OmpF porin